MSRLQNELDLNVLSEDEFQGIRESYLATGISNLKSKVAGMDIQVESKVEATTQEVKPFYSGTELAEVAIATYKSNIKPDDGSMEDVDEGPDTKARRVNARSIQRALVGLRNGGNEGKLSQVGPNGNGNVGKYSPPADNGAGNATNNTDNYYALTTDMTLEQYEEYINEKMERPVPKKGPATEVKYDPHMKVHAPNVSKTDKLAAAGYKIESLEKKLLELPDSAWQSIDIVMREEARELNVTPKELHKAFKAEHGMIPDDWLKENREVEEAGWLPLQEADRLNPAGTVYEVSLMFRGGTQRFKFLWPSMTPPTHEDMQFAVQKFYPFGKLLAFYPAEIDNRQDYNGQLVAVAPNTENYVWHNQEDWVEMSEEAQEAYEVICAEEGEPLDAPELMEDGRYRVVVSDHDTGEEKSFVFG